MRTPRLVDLCGPRTQTGGAAHLHVFTKERRNFVNIISDKLKGNNRNKVFLSHLCSWKWRDTKLSDSDSIFSLTISGEEMKHVALHVQTTGDNTEEEEGRRFPLSAENPVKPSTALQKTIIEIH